MLADAVTDRIIPGAVIAAGDDDHVRSHWICGWADTTSGGIRPMRIDTRFDLASLTKIVSTTILVLALVGERRFTLDDEVASLLPGAFASTLQPVTVEHLLTHTSGLPATIDLWRQCATAAAARGVVRAAAPSTEPGRYVAYSDVGFMLLGQLVEDVTGVTLREAFAQRVSEPLGLTATGFGPVPARQAAATEAGLDGVPWCGVVHDENARFLDGVAGHAGLFATVDDLARIARWWLSDDDRIVPAELRRAAEMCRTAEANGRRGLGWVCRGDRFDILAGWPVGAVSHTGFTGTSMALDRASRAWVIMLTNAVHYGRAKEGIRRLRREVHAELAPTTAPM